MAAEKDKARGMPHPQLYSKLRLPSEIILLPYFIYSGVDDKGIIVCCGRN